MPFQLTNWNSPPFIYIFFTCFQMQQWHKSLQCHFQTLRQKDCPNPKASESEIRNEKEDRGEQLFVSICSKNHPLQTRRRFQATLPTSRIPLPLRIQYLMSTSLHYPFQNYSLEYFLSRIMMISFHGVVWTISV